MAVLQQFTLQVVELQQVGRVADPPVVLWCELRVARPGRAASMILQVEAASVKAEMAIQEAGRRLHRVEILLERLAAKEAGRPAKGKKRRARKKS